MKPQNYCQTRASQISKRAPRADFSKGSSASGQRFPKPPAATLHTSTATCPHRLHASKDRCSARPSPLVQRSACSLHLQLNGSGKCTAEWDESNGLENSRKGGNCSHTVRFSSKRSQSMGPPLTSCCPGSALHTASRSSSACGCCPSATSASARQSRRELESGAGKRNIVTHVMSLW